MITRDKAREIAERFLIERGPMQGWDGIERVLSPEEAESLPPSDFKNAEEDPRWRSCWIVWVRGEAGGVIGVSAETGHVEFAGSAQGG
jgi:hypothetical protein